MHPTRVQNGLNFKLSAFRDTTDQQYDGEQIVQDTALAAVGQSVPTARLGRLVQNAYFRH